MKVHRARQTSIPLQPPLSNKHIYYSGWARPVVSLHTPPTSCYPGQWDSGCTTLGISTRMRKKKTNVLPLSLPTEESRAIATVYILEERVSSSDDVLRFFCSPAETRSAPYSTIIFYYGHEHDITSTEMGCSIHWFYCIIVMNGELNTLASYSLPSAFLFVCATYISPPCLYRQVHLTLRVSYQSSDKNTWFPPFSFFFKPH